MNNKKSNISSYISVFFGGTASNQPAQSSLKKIIKSTTSKSIFLMLLFVFLFCIWGGFAPLDSSAVAPGHIVVSMNHKTIQHLEGGIIGSINVGDGDFVDMGDILIKLNDTKAKTDLQRLETRWNAELATRCRLIAERDKLPEIIFGDSDTLFSNARRDEGNIIRNIRADQIALFEARKEEMRSKLAILEQRVAQYTEEKNGLVGQKESLAKQLVIMQKDLTNTSKLFKQGLATKPRFLELERSVENMHGNLIQISSKIIAADEKISESKLDILATKNSFYKSVIDELKDTQLTILDIEEQIRTTQDTLKRTEIRAPVSGIVTDLNYHTLGGVITPGSKILDIVPKDDKLLMEVRVRSQDIDSIYVGMLAKVQLGVYKSRMMPRINGKVIYISADSIEDSTMSTPNGGTYYKARIELNDEELERGILKEIDLYPGMPGTAFLVKGTRTFFQYIVGPISDSLNKAFIER